MKWFLIIGITIIFLYFLIKKGNNKFWKYVNKNPLEAYDFFRSNDCWFVIHPNELKSKPKDGDWSGPFFVPVPGIGTLKVYGYEDEFEKSNKNLLNDRK